MNKLREDFLRPFDGPANLARVMAVAKRMEQFGLTPGEVLALCAEEQQELLAAQGVALGSGGIDQQVTGGDLICPVCGAALQVMRVNATRCTQVGGDWTHMLSCGDAACNYTRLFKEGGDGL